MAKTESDERAAEVSANAAAAAGKPRTDLEPKAGAKTDHDTQVELARQAELDRQAAVVDAVAKAHTDELPTFGGPLMEPGLGR